jgi:hypothetical protein
VRRGRMSCWGGDQWILAQEKESEGGKSRYEKMMMVYSIGKKRDNRNINKNRKLTITKQTNKNSMEKNEQINKKLKEEKKIK